ncbi:CD97 antigen [Eumeta japonica]|uniref:CD97 antigen n=1 Tax=Eumeta variegata TaxID=151549 RepID=A0A4C1UIL6_EUMVA|nr:CD97 antigen [Eumeta japonica]
MYLASELKSKHRIRRDQLLTKYRFQPIAIKYHKTSYPKNEDRADYEINSYDAEYGGVVSNFTSTIYDDNPPLYPNPEIVSKHSSPVANQRNINFMTLSTSSASHTMAADPVEVPCEPFEQIGQDQETPTLVGAEESEAETEVIHQNVVHLGELFDDYETKANEKTDTQYSDENQRVRKRKRHHDDGAAEEVVFRGKRNFSTKSDAEIRQACTKFKEHYFEDIEPEFIDEMVQYKYFILQLEDAGKKIMPAEESYKLIIVNTRSNPSEGTSNMDLPDDTLADGDLKEHNIIDSVTYVYGTSNCLGQKKENWSWLIFLAGALSVSFMMCTVSYLLSQKKASEFRNLSKLYPICINLCCCLSACTAIYLQAIVGVSSSTRCEKIALLLHYAYCVCAVWIVLLSASVTEYLLYNAVLPLKYNYLLAYGVPAVFVMFNYALSMEHYEIKHYCWMSLEKGMVFGFMAPITTLILINTVIVIIGMQSIFDKQAEMLKAKIYDLVENFSRSEQKEDQQKTENLSDICSPGSSRKNTESSENFERDCEFSEDDVHYVYLEPPSQPSQGTNQARLASPEKSTVQEYKGVLWIDVEMESMAVKNRSEISALRSYLTLALILEPFYAINWVMGVLVIENSQYWSTALLYFVLIISMYIYLAVTLMTHMPIVPVAPPASGAETATESTLTRSRTTDSIPLLEPSVQQPTVSPPPGDSISTISI